MHAKEKLLDLSHWQKGKDNFFFCPQKSLKDIFNSLQRLTSVSFCCYYIVILGSAKEWYRSQSWMRQHFAESM